MLPLLPRKNLTLIPQKNKEEIELEIFKKTNFAE